MFDNQNLGAALKQLAEEKKIVPDDGYVIDHTDGKGPQLVWDKDKPPPSVAELGAAHERGRIIGIEKQASIYADEAIAWVTKNPSRYKIAGWTEKYKDAGKYLNGDTSIDVSDYQEEADDEGITLDQMLGVYVAKGKGYRRLLRKVGNIQKKMERKAKHDPEFDMEKYYWEQVAQFGMEFGYTE